MTTTTWSTTAYVSDTATFRAAGLEIKNALTTLGCVQTADTGQIDWATVTYPGVNVDAGYEIWRFNDALQGTAPVFFKLVYGHHNNGSPAYIRIQVQVGTGSNGTGTLTGTTSTLSNFTKLATPSVGNFPSYGCMLNGNLTLSLKVGSGGEGWLSICRAQDSTGADVATGVIIAVRHTSDNQNLYFSTINFVTPAKVQDNVQGYNSLRIGNLTSSLSGGNNQAYLVWGAYPQPLVHIGLCGFVEGEIANAATFSTALVGSTSRTYLALQSNLVYVGNGLRAAMLYE
jgi:hypothetical protein